MQREFHYRTSDSAEGIGCRIRNANAHLHRVGTEQAEQKNSGSNGEFIKDAELAHQCELTIHVIDMNDWIPNFEQANLLRKFT
jgi:hypothetical protein